MSNNQTSVKAVHIYDFPTAELWWIDRLVKRFIEDERSDCLYYRDDGHMANVHKTKTGNISINYIGSGFHNDSDK